MISVSNLLVDTNLLRLDDDHMHKMIVLLMNKRFMKRVRIKKTFSSVIFSNILSDESINL